MEDLDQLSVRVHQSNLSDREKQEFDEVKTRANNGEYDVTNKSVDTLIADQAAYDADQKAQADRQARLAAQARARHEAAVNALLNALTVALVSKGYKPADTDNGVFDSYVTIELVLANNTAKVIRALKGVLDFQTPLGDTIYKSNLEISESIAAHQSLGWSGELKYNQFNDELSRFKDTELHNVKLKWEPQEILFNDGSRLKVDAQGV